MNDQEYLARPLIQDITYKISDDHVRIESPNTLFADEHRITIVPSMELQALYTSVIREAKGKGIRISYQQHVRKEITERWAEYENACKSADTLFNGIVETAKFVHARGIHNGYRDDQTLEILTQLCGKHMAYRWRTSVVSQFHDIYVKLLDFQRQLAALNSNLYRIYL